MCRGRGRYEVIRDRESHFLLPQPYGGISEHSTEMFLVSPKASAFSLFAWVCTRIYGCPWSSAPLEEHEFPIFSVLFLCTSGELEFSELVAKNGSRDQGNNVRNWEWI